MYLNRELKSKRNFYKYLILFNIRFFMLTNDLIIKMSKQCLNYKYKNRYPPFFPNQNSRMNPNFVLKIL